MTNNKTIDNSTTFFRHVFDVQSEQDGNYAPFFLQVLEKIGWHGDEKVLRDALSINTRVLRFTDFLNAMAFLGYPAEIIKTSKNNIRPDMMPCIFVASSDDNKQKGEVYTDVNAVTGNQSGTVYAFKEKAILSDIIQDEDISLSDIKWFFKMLLRFKKVFKQVFAASLMIGVLSLVLPLFVMNVYDKVIGGYSYETLRYLLVGVLLAVGVEFTLRSIRMRSLSWFAARIDYVVSSSIFAQVVSLPASYVERASVTAQLARFKSFESVRKFFTGTLFLSFVELPFTFILMVAISIIGGWLVLIPIAVSVLYIFLLAICFPRLRTRTSYLASMSVERQNLSIETLNNQETLRCAGGIEPWMNRYKEASSKATVAGYYYNQTLSFIDIISQSLMTLGGVAMIYFGVEEIWLGNLTKGGLIALLLLTWRTLAPLQMACTALPRVGQVRRNIQQINRLMELRSEIELYKPSQGSLHFKGDIEFKNVGLRYNKDSDPVYAGLTFNVPAGSLVSIIGGNSTGKSTTLKLVAGLYRPQAGSIRIDGMDIRQIEPMRLRQEITYVAQEPEFFNASLRDNFRFVKPDASSEQMETVIKNVGLEEWLRHLDKGLDTVIGEYGNVTYVPVGLRSQLALARAYLQDSKIMLIDELSQEFLNSKNGQAFYDYLKENRGKKTILFTSYRQDYIKLADRVVHLYRDGRPEIKENKNGQ